MGLLNDMGYGLLGFSGALNQGLDRSMRQHALDRQDALAQMHIELEKQKLAQMQQQYGLQSGVFNYITGGGLGQAQAVPSSAASPGMLGPSATQTAPQAPVAYRGKTVKDLPLEVMNLLEAEGKAAGLSPEHIPFLYGLAAVESGGDRWAKGDNRDKITGAVTSSDHGLMQINDRNFGAYLKPGENVYDPQVNARIGAQIFAEGLKRSGGDPLGAIGAYNTGKVNSNVPHVSKVLQAMGSSPDAPGVQVAAAPTGTASDASGPPPGVQVQQPPAGAPRIDQGMIARSLQMAVMPGPAGEMARSFLTANKAAVDIFNAMNPGFAEGVKSQYAVQTERGKIQAQNELQGPDYQADTERQKDWAKFEVKDVTDAIDAGKAAQSTLNNITFAKSLDVRTGALEPLKASTGAILAGFGVDPKSVGLYDINDIGKMQAFQATMNNLILNAAGNMKGTLSDKDVAFLKQTVPALGNTPEGNRLMLDFSERVAQRQIERGQFLRSYVDKTGSVKGAGKAWDEYIKDKDLFAGMSTPQSQTTDQAATPAPPGGAVILNPRRR